MSATPLKTSRQKRRRRTTAELSEVRRENESRTELENKMAVETPLPYELEALGQMIIKAIKKLPPEAQPPAVVAAVESINLMKTGVDAFVRELPGWPPSLSPEAIKARAAQLEEFYKQAPKTSPLSIFKPGVSFIGEVEGMVDPLSDNPPTIPHQLAVPFIDNEAQLLINYILKNLA